MNAHKNLSAVIDDGTKEIAIYNRYDQPICKVHIRPSDLSILDRFKEMEDSFDDVFEPLRGIDINADGSGDSDAAWTAIKAAEKIMLDKLNTVFDSDEVSQIFAKRNAFSSVGGEFFCTKVINALGGLIADAINEETAASEKRMSKYLKDKPKVEVVRNDRGTADNS